MHNTQCNLYIYKRDSHNDCVNEEYIALRKQTITIPIYKL